MTTDEYLEMTEYLEYLEYISTGVLKLSDQIQTFKSDF